ncbi:hypothetical protein NKH77_29695 [Streptomyces sp. M19]
MPGATGTLTYEVTADRATGDTSSSKILVGSPELAVGKVPDRTGLKPGSRVEVPIVVRNTGDVATERIDLRLTGTHGLTVADKPGNCRFGEEYDDSPWISCTLKTELGPGETAELNAPFGFTLGKDAMAPWVDFEATAVPAGDPEDPNGDPGTGSPVAFEDASGGDFEKGGESSVTFGAVNHADFAAKGGAIAPDKKDATKGRLSFGLVNHGPGAAYRKDGKPLAYADITLPRASPATTT